MWRASGWLECRPGISHVDVMRSEIEGYILTYNMEVVFTLNDSFQGAIPKSDLRFEIDRLFRENNISIPFPQRDIHIIQKPK